MFKKKRVISRYFCFQMTGFLPSEDGMHERWWYFLKCIELQYSF